VAAPAETVKRNGVVSKRDISVISVDKIAAVMTDKIRTGHNTYGYPGFIYRSVLTCSGIHTDSLYKIQIIKSIKKLPGPL
jgi:hypothetical protein